MKKKNINYQTVIQLRISNELKKKVVYKAGKYKLSDYIRNLLEEDCKEIVLEENK